MIFVLLLVLVQLSCSYADNELLELAFCPSDKPYSFANKKSCCELRVNLFQPLEDQECDGNETACEFEDGCEDFFPTCHGYDSIFGQGFDDEKYNVEYKPLRSNLSGQEIPVLLNHRVIFGEVQSEGEDEKKRKCLYWEEDLKKWRLGQCLAIGFKFFSVGYTLQIEDSTLQKCAVDLDGWVKGSSNEIVEGGSLVGVQTFSSGASEVQSQTATASLTYVTTNGASFKPKCEWKLRRGRFRCVKPRKRNKVLPNLK